jgi:hypothetical protein
VLTPAALQCPLSALYFVLLALWPIRICLDLSIGISRFQLVECYSVRSPVVTGPATFAIWRAESRAEDYIYHCVILTNFFQVASNAEMNKLRGDSWIISNILHMYLDFLTWRSRCHWLSGVCSKIKRRIPRRLQKYVKVGTPKKLRSTSNCSKKKINK